MSTTAPATIPALLTPAEVCRILSVSRRTLATLVKTGLPHIRIGGQLRFSSAALEKWIEGQTGGVA
jgi:excisionase family DNA binding protein